MVTNKTLILFLSLTTNNIFYSITDLSGNVIFWTSIGKFKTKGTKKITTTSLLNSTKLILKKLFSLNCFFLHLKFKGTKKHKKLILKYLKNNITTIVSICDDTSLPHNGCRLKKSKNF